MKPALALLVLCCFSAPLAAQSPCFDWRGGFAPQGIDMPNAFTAVNDMLVWDDGSGAGQRLFAGGHFPSIGGNVVNHIAAWNGTTWQPLGGGVTGFPGYLPFMGGVPTEVDSLCLHDDGSGVALYVGGAWTSAGGQACTGVARWNGSGWIGMPGVEALVRSMASFDDGTGPALYVSGYLYEPQSGNVYALLVWRNNAWQVYAQGVDPFEMLVFDDGSGSKLYASGVGGVRRWDGTSWSLVGGAFSPTTATHALCVHDDGSGAKLYTGGQFTATPNGPAARIARWDGTSWTPLGLGIGDGTVTELTSFPDPFGGPAKLIASGSYTTAGGAPASRVAAWNGSAWSALGSGLAGSLGVNGIHPRALAVYDDHQGSGRDLYVGGQFTSAGGEPVSCFAKWEGCGGTGIPFCAGDGTLATACPCGNSGTSGHGCASSLVAAGGLLGASGQVSPDTITLGASDLPVGVSCVFLQGDALIGSGTVFGDGVRCAGGQLVRLALKVATGGTAAYPEAGDPSISARSAALGAPIPPATNRFYQVYYRDNDASFCAAPQGNTWNVTNAMRITW